MIKISAQDKNTLKNLNYQNLQCDIDFTNLLVSKPWGSEYLLFENQHCAIWILNIDYMQNTSMHCHPEKVTSLVCLNGKVSCNTLNKSYKLKSLNNIFLDKKVFHQTQSISETGSVILEIETPVNKFDLVRIDDTYGRQGKEYEDKKHYTKQHGLTLDTKYNATKVIDKLKLELLTITDETKLTRYPPDTLVSILSQNKHVGKIFQLNELEPIQNMLILIIIFKERVDNTRLNLIK